MMNLIVALPAEARPLVKHFSLQRQDNSAYPIYQVNELTLIVSGVGKAAASDAATFLHANRNSETNNAWLNIGIAGHQSHPPGCGFLIHKITDAESGRSFYPPQVIKVTAQRESLLSLDTPNQEYPPTGLVDMEASGFYATASHFSTGELVQCYKVVSDNADEPAEQITARGVEQLIGGQTDAIEEIVTALNQLSAQLRTTEQAPMELERFRKRWRFTVTETHQLQQLLRRWQVIVPDQSPLTKELAAMDKAKDVLKRLDTQLNDQPVQFESIPS